jgi:hypothetical protein
VPESRVDSVADSCSGELGDGLDRPLVRLVMDGSPWVCRCWAAGLGDAIVLENWRSASVVVVVVVGGEWSRAADASE